MILLSGGTGYIGSKLLKQLLSEGKEVACVFRNKSNFNRVELIKDRITWIHNDESSIGDFFSNYYVEGVIHCATSYGREGEFFSVVESNLCLPITLLRYADQWECQFFINTDSFFVNELRGAFQADHNVYLDNYTKTKFVVRELLKENIHHFKTRIINMELQHVYGNDDSNGKFLHFLKEKLLNNAEYVELTKGTQVRDWIYVDDVVSAYLTVIKHISRFNKNEWNEVEVGTGIGTSLKDVCIKMKQVSGAKTELCFGRKEMQSGEIEKSIANPKILLELGWIPTVSLEEGIGRIFSGK